jgi:hypothetical protein
LIREKEGEGHCKWMQKYHRWMVLFMPFPTVSGTPRGSSRLRGYTLLNMKPQSMVKKPPKVETRSYKPAPKLIKEEKLLQIRSYMFVKVK